MPALTRNRGPACACGRVGAPGWIAVPSQRRRGLRREASGFLRRVRVGPGFAPCAATPGDRMPPPAPSRMRASIRVLAPVAVLVAVAAAAPQASAAPPARPSLAQGSAYLVAPANLIDGHYYESFPGFADFGLTLDSAFALAATGDENSALKGIVTFLDSNGKDPSGATVSTWTGIGTRFAAGGAIGKEALLAEVVGDSPRDFSGHDLIAALNASVCARASTGSNTSCAGAGNYTYATSVFDQAIGIIAQLRAGQASSAA